jgi:hypothetical protein
MITLKRRKPPSVSSSVWYVTGIVAVPKTSFESSTIIVPKHTAAAISDQYTAERITSRTYTPASASEARAQPAVLRVGAILSSGRVGAGAVSSGGRPPCSSSVVRKRAIASASNPAPAAVQSARFAP